MDTSNPHHAIVGSPSSRYGVHHHPQNHPSLYYPQQPQPQHQHQHQHHGQPPPSMSHHHQHQHQQHHHQQHHQQHHGLQPPSSYTAMPPHANDGHNSHSPSSQHNQHNQHNHPSSSSSDYHAASEPSTNHNNPTPYIMYHHQGPPGPLPPQSYSTQSQYMTHPQQHPQHPQQQHQAPPPSANNNNPPPQYQQQHPPPQHPTASEDGKGEPSWNAAGGYALPPTTSTTSSTTLSGSNHGAVATGEEYGTTANVTTNTTHQTNEADTNRETLEQDRSHDRSHDGSHDGSRNQPGENRPLEGEENIKSATKMMLPYPQTNAPTNNLVATMPTSYSQGHTHYPTPSPYYPPPPSYAHHPSGSCPPPETWKAPPTASYYPHYDAPYHFPPQYPSFNNAPPYHPSSSPRPISQGGDHAIPNENKRQRPPSSSSNDYPVHHRVVPSKERKTYHHPPSDRSVRQPTSSPSTFQPAKSVRRRKKMYSDFVGVTYNKTHAKYQACITHYRKQHYLGRYKLAVDAALVYDESARLLKGSSWKVNFPTRHDYEEAKATELEGIGRSSGGAITVDVAGSLAAVAMKVEEIASNVGGPGGPRKVAPGSMFCGRGGGMLPFAPIDGGPHGVPHGVPHGPHGGFRHVEARRREDDVGTRMGRVVDERTTPALLPPPVEIAVTPAEKTEVTPSPTFHVAAAQREVRPPIAAAGGVGGSIETPLPASPNPTRYAVGTEKSTPDSAIRPTVLSYKGNNNVDAIRPTVLSYAGNDEGPVVAGKGLSPPERPPGARGVAVPPVPPVRRKHDGEKSRQTQAQIANHAARMPTTPKARVSPLASCDAATPVIQNGTLAAASALMTLFGTDKSPV